MKWNANRRTEKSESIRVGFGCADAGQSFVECFGQSGVLHRLPDLGVAIADRIIPHGQFGALHFRHRVVQTHVLPDPVPSTCSSSSAAIFSHPFRPCQADKGHNHHRNRPTIKLIQSNHFLQPKPASNNSLKLFKRTAIDSQKRKCRTFQWNRLRISEIFCDPLLSRQKAKYLWPSAKNANNNQSD